MSNYNRLGNCKNPYQGVSKRVLCVCSAGLLRSPTAALVLSQKPYNYNTRAAGISSEYALIPVDEVLLEWADEIVCMTIDQKTELEKRTKKLVINLEIKDNFAYRDKELIAKIKKNYDRKTNRKKSS